MNNKLLNTIHPDFFLTQHGPVEHFDSQEPPKNTFSSSDSTTESFSMDISSLMQKMFDDATMSLTTPIDRLNQYERKDIIERLQEQGLFQLKGAISFVAKKFSCSTATIYRYLSEISD